MAFRTYVGYQNNLDTARSSVYLFQPVSRIHQHAIDMDFTAQQQAILLSLSQGTTRTAACHAARIGRRTLYHWIEADPAFAGALEDAEAAAIAIAEDLAFQCAMRAGEDPRYLRALFFWLKHRAGWVQARPDPAPASPTPASPPPAPSPPLPPTPPVGTTSPATLDAAHLPSGDGAAHTENPAPGVPSVPSENPQADPAASSACRGTPAVCPPPEPAPVTTEPAPNPAIRVPSVPSAPKHPYPYTEPDPLSSISPTSIAFRPHPERRRA